MTATKATWSVVVVYGNPETREAAVGFCDQLVKRFWSEVEFDVSWWSTDRLQAGDSAQHAGRRAAEADLVIFALPKSGELDLEVKGWIERWVPERAEREGAVVGLLAPAASAETEAIEAQQYLRTVAHRAGMDYLTQVPASISHQIPESPESCTERARQVTSVLDEILNRREPPPRLSI